MAISGTLYRWRSPGGFREKAGGFPPSESRRRLLLETQGTNPPPRLHLQREISGLCGHALGDREDFFSFHEKEKKVEKVGAFCGGTFPLRRRRNEPHLAGRKEGSGHCQQWFNEKRAPRTGPGPAAGKHNGLSKFLYYMNDNAPHFRHTHKQLIIAACVCHGVCVASAGEMKI